MRMFMKVLAIVGTNRRKGNIVKICEQILAGAESNGHQIELLNLYDFQINYCIGCWACAKNGTCSQKDDFESIYAKFSEADVIVLGSPVYWGNVTGVMKNFFDRHTAKMTFPLDAKNISKKPFRDKIKFALSSLKNFGPKNPNERKKEFILVSASTYPFRFIMYEVPPTIRAMKIYVSKLRGKVISILVYTDTLIQFFNKKEKILRKSYRLGKRLK